MAVKIPSEIEFPFGIVFPVRLEPANKEEGYFHAVNGDIRLGHMVLDPTLKYRRRLYVFTHEYRHATDLWLRWVIEHPGTPRRVPSSVSFPFGYDVRVQRPPSHKDGSFFEYPKPRICVPKNIPRPVMAFAWALSDGVNEWALWVHDHLIERRGDPAAWLNKK